MPTTASSKTRVVILFGGRSAEHEVSLLSARNVLAALDPAKFEPLLIGIDKEGRWHRESARTLAGAAGDPRQLALDASAPLAPVHAYPEADAALAVLQPDDVVFPVLHGTYGEDGTVQGLLELANVAYVGPGVLGSSVGMDKDVTKRLLRDGGIPVVDFVSATATAWAQRPAEIASAAATKLGFPLFVKPANAGSSVGVHKVKSAGELAAALADAFAYDRKVLLEKGVNAREIECAVLGNEDPQASVPGEVVLGAGHGFYSYEAKYVDPNGATIRIPADLPAEVAAEVRLLSVETFRALELAGMARVDFFLERETNRLFVNEVNTIPGFTAVSMYPKMWEASGLPPRELMTRLVELAQERHRARRALKTSVGG